jgi:uroporphyrinogen decarboxylase
VLDAVKSYVDIIAFSGDAGSQNAPLFGPALYSEMIVPHMRKIMEYVHRNSAMKCFLHSCGSVYGLMDGFVEMGIDILNPLQLSAADMEPERLVKEFGGAIVFWGGGCDTQRVLPYGSEDEVREEVRSRMAVYSTVEGFIFSQVHNIQPDVPAHNILAMMDEVAIRKHFTS